MPGLDSDTSFPMHEDRLRWYKHLQETYDSVLTDEERRAFDEWERNNVTGDGRVATSDWPGWRKYLGPPPWEFEQN